MSYIVKVSIAKYLGKAFALKLFCGEGSSTKVISSENSWIYDTCVYVLLDVLTSGVCLDYYLSVSLSNLFPTFLSPL